MLIFRYLISVLVLTLLHGQTAQVSIYNSKATFMIDDSTEIVRKLEDRLAASGNLGNYFQLRDFLFGKDLEFEYDHIRQTAKLDSIVIVEGNIVRPKISKQIFSSLVSTRPISGTQSTLEWLTGSYSFLTDQTEISFGRFGNNRIAAIVHFRPEFESNFSGIIGAYRSSDRSWQITGQTDIHIENPWRTASTVDVHWKRSDELSQILRIKYEEPHPFGFPLGGQLEFGQELRDGLFVSTNTGGAVVSIVNKTGKWRLGVRQIEISPTTDGKSQGIERLSGKTVFIESTKDIRNNRWLPDRGYHWSITGEAGKHTISDKTNTIGKVQINVGLLKLLNRQLGFSGNIWGQGNWIRKGSVHAGEKIRFGGASSIRGYNEDFFNSDWIVIPTVESFYNLNENSRIFLFADLAIQNEYLPLPFACGLGFIQVSKNSVISFVYGIGRGGGLADGKVHIKLTGRI